MIQIWGTKKCRDTQKAIRFFKERRIEHQYIDLRQKGLSPGELKSVVRALGHVPLNRESKEFAKRATPGVSFNPEKLLLEYPLVTETPIVREGQKATVGYQPEVWRSWLEGEKK